MTSRKHPVNFSQIAIGVLALALGALLYLIDRPATHTYFVPEALSLFQQSPRLLGPLGNQLPTLLHTFAFCLISCGIFSTNRWNAFGICVLWVLIDGTFEIGQQPDIAKTIAEFVPDWFARIPILENTRGYFLYGRFDPLDLFSILLGACSGYGVVMATTQTLSTTRCPASRD